MKIINNNNLPTARMSELSILQGDLKFLSKENYNKLKKSIEKHGFYVPVHVWIDKDDKKWLLDGTQRKHVLSTEGWDDPIPYLIIQAPNMEEAAERLLTLTSQYGTITQEGIDEFIATFELPEIEIKQLTNFDAIFEFPLLPPEPEPQNLEVEPELGVEVESQDGVLYALGPHRVMCGDPREAEIAPEKMDAYRKKYQRIMTGSEDGWQSATPAVDEESE